MTKAMHETHRIAFEGAVDADGHVLEPPDLWEDYIDPQFRDRALRIRTDEQGLEELEIGGERSLMARRGMPSTLGAMGAPDLAAMQKDPERTYLREAPYGSMDPAQRLEVLDAENLDAVVLYTTVGLLWEAELQDPELSQAYTKAYNRWICEFCADSPRLVPTAHLSLSDPVAAAAELERAIGEGAKGCYVAPFTHDARPLGHPDNDPVFAVAQEAGIPFAIHPTFEPQWTKGQRMGTWENVDAVYGHTFIGEKVPLKEKPSDYFRRQCWISCDPDERTIPSLADRFGVDRFLWASDFPHADHTPEYVDDLNELAGMFSDADRRAFLGDNARALFDIGV